MKIKMLLRSFSRILRKNYSSDCGSGSAKGSLVLGVYQDHCTDEFKFTYTGDKINEATAGKLKDLVKQAHIRKGVARVFTNVVNDYKAIAVSGLGEQGVSWNDTEALDECKENIRIAAAHGTRLLQDEGMNTIFLEPFTNAEVAAEAAFLSVWTYQDFNSNPVARPKLELLEGEKELWERGRIKAEAQNLARKIEDAPANQMTPTNVAELAIESLCPCGANVEVRDRDWLELKKMNAFLTIAKSSCEQPLMLEIGYCGGDPNAHPFVFVGKGITFDTGGLCLKKCDAELSTYRSDLAGAAVIIAVIKCCAQFALPLNIIGLVPLCEHLTGGYAVKPGDLIFTANGKSIIIENPENEGRIVLTDPLIYSEFYKPCAVIELSTTIPGVKCCLGTSSTAAFSSSDMLWEELERAGGETGDRMWRMPFWSIYRKIITGHPNADVHNVGRGSNVASVAKAASFNKEFCPIKDFVHLDISGTGIIANGVGHPYLREGTMSGRPTRTLAQFLYQIACPHTRGDEC